MTIMPVTMHKLPAVCALAVAIRLALFATQIPSILERRPELSTPLTSFRSLREGVFLYQHGMDPYQGGVFHHSPLYLFAFAHLLPVSSFALTTCLWCVADIASALSIVRLWRSRKRSVERDALVSAIYLLNPYTITSCLARSTTSLDNTLLTSAIALAASRNYLAMPLLAMATHTSLYPLLLLPPFLMLQHKRINSVALYTATFALVYGLNHATLGAKWMRQTLGVILTVSDLTPNVGMWWYFFTEMFDHFRLFFLGVFQLHNLIYVAPLCLRFQHDPLFAVLAIVSIFSTWKSYPTLGDLAVWAGLLACFPEVVSNLRHPLFTLTVYLYTCILLPLLHSLWLLTGTGNANFFYAATMVHGLNTCLAIVDVVGGAIRAKVKQAAPASATVVQLNQNA